MVSKHKSNDAGGASKLKRDHDVLLNSDKVKIMGMIDTGNKTFT